MKKPTRYLIVFFLFALIGIVLFFLRLPSFSNTFCDPDLGDPAYGARMFLEGKCVYSHSVITKPPGSFLIYALVFSIFGTKIIHIHFLSAFWALASCMLLYFIAGRNKKAEAGFVAAGLYAFYQADLVSAGLCANFETWTILPALGTLALVARGIGYQSPTGGYVRFFFAGVVACIGFWMKQPAILYIVSGALVILLQAAEPNSTRQQKIRVVKGFFLFVLGISLAFITILGMMKSIACISSLLGIMNPMKMGGYLGTVDFYQRCFLFVETAGRFFLSNRFLILFSVLGLAGIIMSMRVRIHGASRIYAASIFFFIASVLMVYSGGRFFGHYFVVIIPFFCLLIGLAYRAYAIHLRKVTRFLLIGLVFAGGMYDQLPEIRFAGLSTKSVFENGSVASEKIFALNDNREIEPQYTNQLLSYLEWQPLVRQAGEYIRQNIEPGDTIWTLDYFPDLYHFTNTFAPTRHHNNFEFVTKSTTGYYGLWHNELTKRVRNNRHELMADLKKAPPRFIVTYRFDCPSLITPKVKALKEWPHNKYGDPMATCFDRMKPFPELQEFIKENYEKVIPEINSGISAYRQKDSFEPKEESN